MHPTYEKIVRRLTYSEWIGERAHAKVSLDRIIFSPRVAGEEHAVDEPYCLIKVHH